MLRRATARSKSSTGVAKPKPNTPPNASLFQSPPTTSPSNPSNPSNPISNHTSSTSSSAIPQDELIERIRLTIKNAHVFKLPPKPSTSGWRGAEWRDKVWQGTLKVVERGEETAVLLVDSVCERNIFAVCPIHHNINGNATGNTTGNATGNTANNAVDRCIDSSRYFVLRIQNAQGRHMYIGLAFNERNDAFDFNTALEDSRREKEAERKAALSGGSGGGNGRTVDYRMKEGEKIHVALPKGQIGGVGSFGSVEEEEEERGKSAGNAAARRREARKARLTSSTGGSSSKGLLLAPSSKDTPSRLA